MGIFAWNFSGAPASESVELAKSISGENEIDLNLANRIIDGVENNRKLIDDAITNCAPEWPINKISKIDLSILRIAVCEILIDNETPVKVVIDEAVEMAKEYGNENSQKFVNGVLGAVAEKLSSESKV